MKNHLFLTLLCATNLLFGQSYVPERHNHRLKIPPSVPINAYAFNLRQVRLSAGSPFKNAMDLDATYLLSIKPDRLLHRFHAHAALFSLLGFFHSKRMGRTPNGLRS
jgi:uncharacterized protein